MNKGNVGNEGEGGGGGGNVDFVVIRLTGSFTLCISVSVIESNISGATDARLISDIDITTSIQIPSGYLIYWKFTFVLDAVHSQPIYVQVFGTQAMCGTGFSCKSLLYKLT